jgi:hypothetical protein
MNVYIATFGLHTKCLEVTSLLDEGLPELLSSVDHDNINKISDRLYEKHPAGFESILAKQTFCNEGVTDMS